MLLTIRPCHGTGEGKRSLNGECMHFETIMNLMIDLKELFRGHGVDYRIMRRGIIYRTDSSTYGASIRILRNWNLCN